MRGGMRSVGAWMLAVVCLASCGGRSDPPDLLSPILFVPGYGMGALHVEVSGASGAVADFDFLLPAMNPNAIFTPPIASAEDYARQSGLAAADLPMVREWLKLDIGADGSASTRPGVNVRPVSIGENFSAECPRYVGMMKTLAADGWVPNRNLKCIPFDYRFPPGETEFAVDLERLIEASVAAAGGTKATVACHSQGCLLAYHFLRTRDPSWLRRHVGLFFTLAGQFSGCSDCLRWAFQKEWSWDANNGLVAPSDMTWVGELALGLQTSVYEDVVLYRWGSEQYRASDAVRLLREAGALAIARATDRYALERQAWFQKGADEHAPLQIPTRVVFGTNLPTTVGFEFQRERPIDATCEHPSCAEPYHTDYPGMIRAAGDSGDSGWMNQAPQAWLENPACQIREFEFVSHMDIFENNEVLELLAANAREVSLGTDSCR